MEEEARTVLERVIVQNGDDFAGLSKLIGRNPTYIQQFIKHGSPKKLPEVERGILARYFGVAENILADRRRMQPKPAFALSQNLLLARRPVRGPFLIMKRLPARLVLMKNGCASRGWTHPSSRLFKWMAIRCRQL